MVHACLSASSPMLPRNFIGANEMSGLTRFFLGVFTLFTIGMIVHDPDEAHRPPVFREADRGYFVVEYDER